MPLAELENLVRLGALKREPPIADELDRFLAAARKSLEDSGVALVSLEGRFDHVYKAAHSAALAALRWHGYRSEHRYTVFQCLSHTLGWDPAEWRLLDRAHNMRNRSEYDAIFEPSEAMVAELRNAVTKLVGDVARLIGA